MGTILLVDDNRDILQLFSALLEEAGHVVVTAVNGREAFEIALKSRPDLIISDWMMPEMDGVALFHAVRGTPATAKIPIILTTAARPAPDIAVQAILLKPFQMPRLFRLIELYAKPTE
jgi:CheY-like chemotaxis protein